MEYQTLLKQWKERREEIKQEYSELSEDGTRKYSIRDLAKKYGVSDARIFNILHEYDKKIQKNQSRNK